VELKNLLEILHDEGLISLKPLNINDEETIREIIFDADHIL